MKWWKTLWQQRRENDRIKLQIWFLLGAGIALIIGGMQGIQLYRWLHQPLEYQMSAQEPPVQMRGAYQKIQELDVVEAATWQQAGTIQITCSQGTSSLPCIQVSEDYLRCAYGLENSSAMRYLYLNTAAYEQLLQATGRGRQDSRQETQWLVGYSCQDMGQEQGMARVVLVEDLFEEENPCVYLAGDPVQLENMATVLRVRVKQRDLTGSQRKELEETGFYLMNEEQEELVQVNGNSRLMSIRYILLLALVCFLAYGSLKRYGR